MNNYVKVFLWYHTGKKCQKKKGAFLKKAPGKIVYANRRLTDSAL